MINVLRINLVDIHQAVSDTGFNVNIAISYLSVVEHTVLKMGFILDRIYTEDITKCPFPLLKKDEIEYVSNAVINYLTSYTSPHDLVEIAFYGDKFINIIISNIEE